MSDLIGKFDDLGYDLLDLDSLIYLSKGDPETDQKKICTDHCETCAVTCSTCGAGCSSGPT